MMDSGKWTIALLLISEVLTAPSLDGHGGTIEVSVPVGEEVVDLVCGDDSSDANRRLWKKDDEIWAFMSEVVVDNERVSSVNRSAVLRIVNATLDDEGYYTCTAYTQPRHTSTVHLQVKEKPGEAPHKPLGVHTEPARDDYRIGNAIRFYCNTRQPLVDNRIGTGTPTGWESKKKYHEQYIGRLLRRLKDIEDRVTAIERRITIIEDNISENVDKISSTDKFSVNIESQISSVIVTNISSLGPSDHQMSQLRALIVTNAFEHDPTFKCMTAQLGTRNGHSVFVYTWVLQNFNKKCPKSGLVKYFSPAFYHTIPGYKFRLKGTVFSDKDIYIYLSLLPGPYDDQLTWPFTIKHDLTVLTNNGSEVLHRSFDGQLPTCHLNRPTAITRFSCYTLDADWNGVWMNRKHILKDGSVVARVYFYI